MRRWLESDQPRPKKRRVQYTREQKKTVVSCARAEGPTKAAAVFDVPLRNIHRWLREDFSCVAAQEGNLRQVGAGRPPLFRESCQSELLAMIQRARSAGRNIARQDLQVWATTIADTKGIRGFKASEGWLTKFMSRHSLSLRRRTGNGYGLPADYDTRLCQMVTEIEMLREKFSVPDKLIINADETAIFYDNVDARTVDFKGERSIRVRSTGKEKSRITAMLACALSGHILQPLAILKGSAVSRLRFQPSAQILRNMRLECQRQAWMDTQVMIKWVLRVLIPYTNRQHSILLLDNFSAHSANEVKRLLQSCNCHVVMIPPNMTSVAQPCDIRINAQVKRTLRKVWRTEMLAEYSRRVAAVEPTTVLRLPSPKREQVLEWLLQAISSCSERLVIASWEAAGIRGKVEDGERSEDDGDRSEDEGEQCERRDRGESKEDERREEAEVCEGDEETLRNEALQLDTIELGDDEIETAKEGRR